MRNSSYNYYLSQEFAGTRCVEGMDNRQKYENYKEQFKRLDKAFRYEFYLEALFIEFAIMEDRTESILRYAGKWEAYLKKRGKYQITIDSKLKYISHFAQEKGSLLNKYFGDDLLDKIAVWKDDRNKLIHALMKQSLTTEDLREIATRGKTLTTALRNKSTNYRRAVECYK